MNRWEKKGGYTILRVEIDSKTNFKVENMVKIPI
jgi:hypothetical protein